MKFRHAHNITLYPIHSTLTTSELPTPSITTLQTSSSRTQLNLAQIRCESDSQNSFLVVTCKKKQFSKFSGGTGLQKPLSSQEQNTRKREWWSPKTEKKSQGELHGIFKFQKQSCLPLLKTCSPRQKLAFLHHWDGNTAGAES